MINGFILAAVLTTQPLRAPSDITQPEAMNLAGLAADLRANWLANFTVVLLNRPGTDPGDSWVFQTRATGGSRDPHVEKYPDMGAYKVNRRTADVVDVATGMSVASFPELKAAQMKLLKGALLERTTLSQTVNVTLIEK